MTYLLLLPAAVLGFVAAYLLTYRIRNAARYLHRRSQLRTRQLLECAEWDYFERCGGRLYSEGPQCVLPSKHGDDHWFPKDEV